MNKAQLDALPRPLLILATSARLREFLKAHPMPESEFRWLTRGERILALHGQTVILLDHPRDISPGYLQARAKAQNLTILHASPTPPNPTTTANIPENGHSKARRKLRPFRFPTL